jgi:hypothetical protein
VWDEIPDLTPVGLNSILPAFEGRDKSLIPLWIVSQAAKQTKAFKTPPFLQSIKQWEKSIKRPL